MTPAGRKAALALGAISLAICALALGRRAHAAAARPMLARPDWDAQLAAARQVDANAAPASALERLPGIGPSLARAIVAERERGGPFTSPEDLARVRGIGPELARRLRAYLRAGDAAQE